MSRFPLFCLLLFTAWLLQGCGRDGFAASDESAYLHKVDLVAVALQPGYTIEREFAGVVEANQTSELGFELSGRIDTLYVNEGDSVSAGQLLAELDSGLLHSQRDELKARLDSLQSELELAQRNLHRVEQLRQERLASEHERDALFSREQVLQAAMREVQAALQANRLRLDKSRLHAPFAARIGRRSADMGTVIEAGMPVFTLLESGTREVRVGIPTALFPELTTGHSVQVRNGLEVVDGVVLARGARVDQATRTRSLRIAVNAPWTPGELAYAQLEQLVELEGIWLQAAAVTEGVRGTWVVFAAVPQSDATALLETRSVTVHHSVHDRVYVSGALANDEWLVSHGLHRLAPGQLVRVAENESFIHAP